MTIDLTKIDKPFGELDRETKGALLLAEYEGARLEFRDPNSTLPWCEVLYCSEMSAHLMYRVKPVPLTKDTIDWSQVADGWDYCMRRPLGAIGEAQPFLFRTKPTGSELTYTIPGLALVTQSSYVRGTCDWKDSLLIRPGKE